MGKTSEVENASLMQKLGMAVADRTISTLHLLSIPPNLGQDFAKTCKSCSGLMFHITPAGNIIFPSPLFTAPSGLFPPVDPPPQPHVGQVKLGGILPITGCSTAVPDCRAGLPARAALPACATAAAFCTTLKSVWKLEAPRTPQQQLLGCTLGQTLLLRRDLSFISG